ncbi:hypothetical protein GCM10027262_24490 [Nocardia tengchongensis]
MASTQPVVSAPPVVWARRAVSDRQVAWAPSVRSGREEVSDRSAESALRVGSDHPPMSDRQAVFRLGAASSPRAGRILSVGSSRPVSCPAVRPRARASVCFRSWS